MTILTALPIYNESPYVDHVLRAVKRHTDSILVIDDGSTDGTSDRLKQHRNINMLSHQANLGYGQSLIDAFDFAKQNVFDWIITIDCDKQHEPDHIPCFFGEIKKDDSDIISGSRYLQPINNNETQPPLERVRINKSVTAMLNGLLHLRLTDAFCGFKAYRVEALQQLDLSEKGYGLPLQLWVQAAQHNLQIREIPVPLIYHDPSRNFQGALEDPQQRLKYYLSVLEREMELNAAQVIA
jgi:glycosyltransferase involved in cell wall biosynthesis